MQPYRDEDLILYLYGESPDAAAMEARLERDDALRARVDELRTLMGTVSEAQWQEPPADHETRMWQRLAPELTPHRPHGLVRLWRTLRWPSSSMQRAIAFAAVLTLVIGAFFLGRMDRPMDDIAPIGAATITVANERILLSTVGEHLSRSHRVLRDLANTSLAPESTAILEGPASARSLLADNRLLRQTAAQGGQPQVAAVLETLERVLTELANLPADHDPAQLEAVRQRIEDQDLLFKLRVLDQTVERATRVPQRQRSAPAGDHI